MCETVLPLLWYFRPEIAHGLRERGKHIADFAFGNFFVEQTEDRPGDMDGVHLRIMCSRERSLDLAEKAVLRGVTNRIFLRPPSVVVTAANQSGELGSKMHGFFDRQSIAQCMQDGAQSEKRPALVL